MSEQSANEINSLNYQELRKMVEAAASYRDTDVYIVIFEGKWKVHEERSVIPEGAAVIHCKSPGKPGGLEPVNLAQIGVAGAEPKNLLKLQVTGSTKDEPADAVFWTPAAVEKFVVPYYASVYGDQAPQKLTGLIDILGTVRTGDTTMPLAQGMTDSVAFAVAHMPKSEYVQVGGDAGMVVLTKEHDGTVKATAFSDYVNPPK